MEKSKVNIDLKAYYKEYDKDQEDQYKIEDQFKIEKKDINVEILWKKIYFLRNM